ncbi:hypothetical protein PRIPAC_81868, partial [Pristionchus pacificus]|uniref:G protein-coupled receptor n=1 Tax=Pristionchus pacificus TaxID=54126 RepID=A0A2A6C3Z5_PRIPA
LRLRFILSILHGGISSIVRLYVMHYQVFGPVERSVTVPLIVCSLIREAFLAYFTSLYERGGPSTTLFFVVLEITHLSSAYLDSLSLIYDYTSDIAFVMHCGIFTVVGTVTYMLVNNSDRSEMAILKKKGASIDSYSIARSYQLKENLDLIKMFGRILVPFIVCVSPEFIFYPAFSLIPKGIGYDNIRYISIALYDVWLAIMCILTVALVPLCATKISKHMPSFMQYSLYSESFEPEGNNSLENTNTYFTLLQSNWNDVNSKYRINDAKQSK